MERVRFLHSQGAEITVFVHCPKWVQSEQEEFACLGEEQEAHGNWDQRQPRESSA